MTRRGFLKILGTAAAGTLAGCLAVEIGRDPDQFWDEPYAGGDFGISDEELIAMFNLESARLDQQLYEMSILDSPWKELWKVIPENEEVT